MAEQFIEEIYEKSELLYSYRLCLEYLNTRNYTDFNMLWTDLAPRLIATIEDWSATAPIQAEKLRELAYRIPAVIQDPLMCYEIISEGILPLLYQYISGFCGIDVTEGKWRLRSSRVGYITLSDAETGYNIHSLSDPMWEAREHAKAIYSGKYDRVVLMGGGLGYLAYQLWEISIHSIDIYLLENDQEIVDYARLYGVLDKIDEDRLHIIVEKDAASLLDKFANSTSSCSLNLISDWMSGLYEGEQGDAVKKVIENEHAKLGFDRYFPVNYYRIKEKAVGYFRDIDYLAPSDTYIVVAAGPSVDDNLEYLRANKGKKTIIAVNTILKRLLANGIEPDFVCLMDPTQDVYPHIDGILEQTKDIPLITQSIAYWKFVQDYKGPVYRVLSDTCDMVMEEAKNQEIDLWFAGSTVSNLAIEAAIRFGAKTIELVGMDLGFPGGKYHAGDEADGQTEKFLDQVPVQSVTGEIIPSVETFCIFRADIEKQIVQNPSIEFINLAPGGARIAGTVSGAWKKERELGEKKIDLSVFSEEIRTSLIRLEANLCETGEGWDRHVSEMLALDLCVNKLTVAARDTLKDIILCWIERADKIENYKAKIYLLSVLFALTDDPEYLKKAFMDIDAKPIFTRQELYFVYTYLCEKLSAFEIEEDAEFENTINHIFTDIVDSYVLSLSGGGASFSRLYKRDDALAVVLLSEKLKQNRDYDELVHKTVKVLTSVMGKKVLVINTLESRPIVGAGAVYGIDNSNFASCEDYSGEFTQNGAVYFQCDQNMPDDSTMLMLLNTIRSKKPGIIVNVGERALMSLILDGMLPMISVSTNCSERELEEVLKNAYEDIRKEDNHLPILIYKSEGVCYGILNHFAERFGNELEKLGETIQYFDAEKSPLDDLLVLAKNTYKAVIGIQSYLFSIKLTNGEYLHDLFDAPIFNMILDHPAAMYPNLIDAPGKLIVLTHDRNYKAYIERYYPEINEVDIISPGGDESASKCEKEYSLSFVGTSRDYHFWVDEVEALEKKYPGKIYALVEKMKTCPDETYESAFEEVFGAVDIQRMNECKAVYLLVMNYFRDKILRTILDAGIELHVFGNSWNNSIWDGYDNLIIHKELSQEETLEVYSKSKLTINIMSWHKDGMTERIANAMLNRAVVISDKSRYLEENFTTGEDIVLFSLNEIDKLPAKLTELIADDAVIASISAKAYDKAVKKESFAAKAKVLLELINKYN